MLFRTTPSPLSTHPRRQAKAIPGPRAAYPGQFIRLLAVDRIALFEKMAQYGDISQIRIARQPIVLLMHPDQIRQVLVDDHRSFVKGRALERTRRLLGNGLLTSEAELHKRNRKLVQPAFHRERIASYASVIGDWCDRIAGEWRDGAERDLHADMMRLTLGVAGQCFFGVDVDDDAEALAEVLGLSLRMFDYAILPLGELLEHAPIRWVRQLHHARRRLDARITALVETRRAAPQAGSDLLSALVTATDAEGGMSDRQLRDEIVTLLMAGHETTANALTWTWYLLSSHPVVEAKLHEELACVLAGRAPSADDCAQLPYTRAVLAESMRLYPPAWMIERRAVEDVVIGDRVIPRGALVLMSQYLVHRDPRWWDAPAAFRPERWLAPTSSRPRPRLSYFPFGAGPRVCVGEHFAWMEGVIALATLAQRWRFRRGDPRTPALEPLVTLRPKGGLRLVPQQRHRRPDRGRPPFGTPGAA